MQGNMQGDENVLEYDINFVLVMQIEDYDKNQQTQDNTLDR